MSAAPFEDHSAPVSELARPADRATAAQGSPSRRSPVILPLRIATLVAVAFINVVVLAFAYHSLGVERAAAYADARNENVNMARLLDADVSAIIDRAGIPVSFVARELNEQLRGGGIDRENIWALIDAATQPVVDVSRVGVFDEQGKQVCPPSSRRCLHLDIADRDYFRRQRSSPSEGILLTGPYRSRIDQRPSMIVSRALVNRDGSFAGVAMTLIPVSRFEESFSRLSLGPGGAVTLLTRELALVAGFPAGDELLAAGSNRAVSSAFAEAVAEAPSGGHHEWSSPMDGIRRMTTYRPSEQYPLYVLVSRSADTVMADWKARAFWITAVCLLVLFGSGSMVWFWLRTLSRSEAARFAVAAAERRARMAAGAGKVGLWELSRDNRGWASPEHRQIFGDDLEGSEWSLERFLAAVVEEDRERVARLMQPDADVGSLHFECRIRRADGELRWILVHGERDTGAGDAAPRMTGAVIDIDDRKRAEEALATLKAQLADKAAALEAANEHLESAVLARTEELEMVTHHLAHNLQTPARAVDGWIAMLREDAPELLSARTVVHLERIGANVARMGRLTQGLLRFTSLRFRAVADVDVDMHRVLADVREATGAAASARDAEILLPDDPPAVAGDPALMHMIFAELIDNALKFAAPGRRLTITVSAARHDGHVEYVVADNGRGFAAEYRTRVFRLFERLDARGVDGGEGVGLALVQRAVALQRGHIEAAAAVGGGAAFTMTFRAARSPRAIAS